MSEILGPPRKVLFVEPDHDRFWLVSNQFPNVSRRVSWVTSSLLSDAYNRAQDALKRRQPFDLVIIDIPITEINQGLNLARDMKNTLSVKPFIALAVPELTLVNRIYLREIQELDYFTDKLGEEETLRELLLYEAKWRQSKQSQKSR